MPELFVCGVFRSGTTLVSRVLSAHPACRVVSDPCVYFFKAYRAFHLARAGASGWHPEEPTSDAFLDPHHDVLERILDADLSEDMPLHLQAWVRDEVRRWKAEQHPELCARLDAVRGGTFAEFYRALVDAAVASTGSDDPPARGVKVSWCEEYVPALARAFPDLRAVLVVRDLRSVVASQGAQRGAGAGERPLLFYARHWRKSLAFAHLWGAVEPELAGRVHVVAYEDLVGDPDAETRRLAAAVGLAHHPAMTGAEGFPDLAGRGTWVANSAFEAEGGIYTASRERWRSVLAPERVRALEALAAPELVRWGHSLEGPPADPLTLLGPELAGAEPAFDELAAWLQPFRAAAYLRDPGLRAREVAAEALRRAAIEGTVELAPELVRRMFVRPAVLDDLRAAWARRAARQSA